MAKRRSCLSPIAARELKSRMRGAQAYAVLTVYMAIVGGIALLLYAGAVIGNTSAESAIRNSSRVGGALFYIVVGLQVVLVCFVAPAFTAGAVSAEREKGTLDLLKVSLLTPAQIATGKLASALGYILILILATLPLFSLAFLLGGVEPAQLAAALSVVIASAALFTTLGLCVSSRAPTTLSAVIITYGLILGIVIGSAVLVMLVFPSLESALRSTAAGGGGSDGLTVFTALFYLLLCLSPVSALVATEANFQRGGEILAMAIGAAPGPPALTLPAPFLILTAVYLLASIALLWLAVRAIHQH